MTHKGIQLEIVVPCYNESENIPLILKRFSEIIEDRDIGVLLVDNGSTDGSEEVLAELLPKYPFAGSVKVPVNKGYGYGIVAGLRAARAGFIGWTHADMQTDPRDVARAWDLLAVMTPEEREKTYVKGRRKGRPLADQFFTMGMSVYETLYLGMPLWDINAQPNVFPRTYFESLDFFPDDFSLDLYLYYMARKKGMKVKRFEVAFTDRLHGASKWNDQTWASKKKFIRRTMDFSRKLKKQL